jgi:pimeloyl-ACP methyl ester carboxylesterase
MFLEIDGNRVFTLDFGQGPKTFLAHSGWIANFEDWIATLAPLSKSWRTVVYDHRGTGETKVPVEKITGDALVDDVFRVMDALAIDKCILGGFSRGVITVLRAALRDPSRFEGLALVCGTGGITPPDAPPATRPPPSQWPGETHDARLRWFIERCTPEPDSEHFRRWGHNILRRAEQDASEQLYLIKHTETIDWPSRLSALQVPTLLINGDQDFVAPTAAMQYVASLLPNSRLEVLPKTGHIPAMTQPDRVAQLIADFFS